MEDALAELCRRSSEVIRSAFWYHDRARTDLMVSLYPDQSPSPRKTASTLCRKGTA
jgi:hypothetical protein